MPTPRFAVYCRSECFYYDRREDAEQLAAALNAKGLCAFVAICR